jgi:hypothetical protein
LDRETQSGDPITLEEYGAHFCPYGMVGEKLWVREHWMACEVQGQGIGAQFVVFDDEWDGNEPRPKELRRTDGHFKWGSHAAFHLPRWASRITLELEAVLVQRVQSISEADARAEGIQEFDFPIPPNPPDQVQRMYGISGYFPQTETTAVKAYRNLWQGINGKRPGCEWSANPWIFALTVRVVV